MEYYLGIYSLKNGRKVLIYQTDHRGPYPIRGLFMPNANLEGSWTKEGLYFTGIPTHLDLKDQ